MTERGVIVGMDEAAYHAHSALSSTGARALLKSPARFRWEREHPVIKDVFDVGTAVHTLVLGTGSPIDVHEFDSWRAKAAQEARDESRANGRIPVLAKDHDPLVVIADSVLAHPLARQIIESAPMREASMFANDPTTGVEMRARADLLGPSRIGDLKTAVSAADDDFGRDAAKYGYHVQMRWYQRLLRLARGDDADFLFIVVEKSPPHLVNVIELDAEFAQIGDAQMDRALRLYAECAATDTWPGYERADGEPNLVGPPAWLAYQEGMEF